MTQMPIADLLDPIKELVQADIFVDSDEQLAFGHDLIREAVRASSPAPVRRALDRQAAGVLLVRGALPVEVAQQLADSADPGDNTAIETLLHAADALGTTDPGTAATLAGRALEARPCPPSPSGALGGEARHLFVRSWARGGGPEVRWHGTETGASRRGRGAGPLQRRQHVRSFS